MMRNMFLRALLCAVGAIGLARDASACAVCFGDPNNPQSHALNQAILTLLGVLLFVSVIGGAFILRIVRNSAEIQEEPTPEPSSTPPGAEVGIV